MTGSVSISIRVATDCATTFRAFVDDIDVWWQRGPKFRAAGTADALRFEPGPDGALVQELGAGREHILGKVLAWEPPTRVLLRWRLTNFAPDEATEVEILFTPLGDETRVTIEHRGLDRLRSDHPARHGQPSPRFEIDKGRWWRDVLDGFKTHVRG